uniref:Uncharacterized protein n=1 Tax=Anguilla anguilla TaxID=7936 RepID=A0A0E9PJN1_ANGAN
MNRLPYKYQLTEMQFTAEKACGGSGYQSVSSGYHKILNFFSGKINIIEIKDSGLSYY